MKWVVVAVIVVFLLLLILRFLRSLTLGQATIHIAHMKSEAEALQVANVLKGLRGVEEARVDLERHLARITYPVGGQVLQSHILSLRLDVP